MSFTAKLSVVAAASALIALHQIQLPDELESMFAECLIPPAVAREIASSVATPKWITQRQLMQSIDQRLAATALGAGETEAITLALELGTHSVMLDELPGRKMAAQVGVPVIGTLGVLLAAKHAGVIVDVAPRLHQLLATGFYASPDLVDQILTLAGEHPLPHR